LTYAYPPKGIHDLLRNDAMGTFFISWLVFSLSFLFSF
jgi:hypothetical protein